MSAPVNRVTPQRAIALGVLAASLSALAYSTNTPLGALVIAGGSSAIYIIFARALGAALISAGLMVFDKRTTPLHQNIGVMAPLSLLLFAQGACYIGSVAYIPVSLAALIFFTWPVWVGLYEALFARGRAPLNRTVSRVGYFIVALAGLAVALQADVSTLDYRGLALALAGALSMAAYVVMAARYLPKTASPLTLNCQINLGITVLSAVVVFSGEFSPPGSDGQTLALLGLLIVCYALATCLQIVAVRQVDASLAALFFNIEPIASIALAVLLLNEVLSVQQFVGGLIVIGTLVIFAGKNLRSPA